MDAPLQRAVTAMLQAECTPSLAPRLVRRNDGRLRVSAPSLEIWASEQERREQLGRARDLARRAGAKSPPRA